MNIFIYLTISAIVVLAMPLQAGEIVSKTPNDVYRHVMQLKQQVWLLREAANITKPWPVAEKPSGLAPRHVLQKSLEVLDKIKRLRRIRKMGPITVPLFPTRNITPNDVYDMAERLIGELSLFPALVGKTIKPVAPVNGKTPSDVYQELWSLSLAMNPLLGVRGLKPTDVYAQSLKILEQVKFLRVSQSLSLQIAPPPITEGKRLNHGLQQAYRLLDKIAIAEHNLWMEPIKVPSVPQIIPDDVHNGIELIITELENIKIYLGIAQVVKPSQNNHEKTPSEVLQQLQLATQILKGFIGDSKRGR